MYRIYSLWMIVILFSFFGLQWTLPWSSFSTCNALFGFPGSEWASERQKSYCKRHAPLKIEVSAGISQKDNLFFIGICPYILTHITGEWSNKNTVVLLLHAATDWYKPLHAPKFQCWFKTMRSADMNSVLRVMDRKVRRSSLRWPAKRRLSSANMWIVSLYPRPMPFFLSLRLSSSLPIGVSIQFYSPSQICYENAMVGKYREF